MTLTRRMSHYMITYYLPSSLFVVVSWTSFLIPSEDIQGRMALLVTLFLVLVQYYNTHNMYLAVISQIELGMIIGVELIDSACVPIRTYKCTHYTHSDQLGNSTKNSWYICRLIIGREPFSNPLLLVHIAETFFPHILIYFRYGPLTQPYLRIVRMWPLILNSLKKILS